MEQPKLPEGKAKDVRFMNTGNPYKEPADILPDSTIAECLDDPVFNTHKDIKRAIDDARTEIQENEMEQTRRSVQYYSTAQHNTAQHNTAQ